MTERISYQRRPAIHCWIKHITESNYDDTENIFHTVFGKVKRIRIVATIIEKNEEFTDIDDFSIGLDGDREDNTQLIFQLDDGTSIIRGAIENPNPEYYQQFHVGQIVDVVGLPRKKEDNISLRIEIIRKIEEPNFILLRDAEIINRIKSGDIYDINGDLNNETDALSEEFELDNFFEEDQP